MLSFEAGREAAAPVAAASVLPLRDHPGGSARARLEVLCIERSGKSGFLGGAIVFPGGKVSPSDRVPWPDGLARLHPRAPLLGADEEPFALVVAAARETLEEAALLPVTEARPLGAGALERLAARARQKAAPPLAELLAAEGAALDIAAFVPFGRWITPEAEPRRFDARFFLVRTPAGQAGAADEHEAVKAFWAAPSDVLARFHAGELFLAPPTLRMLELLAPLPDVDAALELASAQSLLPICPTFVPGDPPFLAIPGDPTHAVRERRVDGGTRFVLEGGRFVSRDP